MSHTTAVKAWQQEAEQQEAEGIFDSGKSDSRKPDSKKSDKRTIQDCIRYQSHENVSMVNSRIPNKFSCVIAFSMLKKC